MTPPSSSLYQNSSACIENSVETCKSILVNLARNLKHLQSIKMILHIVALVFCILPFQLYHHTCPRSCFSRLMFFIYLSGDIFSPSHDTTTPVRIPWKLDTTQYYLLIRGIQLRIYNNYKGIENTLTSFIGNSKESNETLSWFNTDHLRWGYMG